MAKETIWDGADYLWDLDVLGVAPFIDGPKGITVHYTADGDIDRVKRSMKQDHLGYHFLISRDGKLHQTASLDKRVNHAGVAAWNAQSPNRTHLAVSIVSWGLLETQKDGTVTTWSKLPFPNHVIDAKGHKWDPATRLQEARLTRLLEELMKHYGISAANICGHDECAIPAGRKVDPGGVLSRPLSSIRKELAS